MPYDDDDIPYGWDRRYGRDMRYERDLRRERERQPDGDMRRDRDSRYDGFWQSGSAGTPVLAIVALNEQRITIYDANGKILQAPVSTGQTGYETPAGIYSVVQKKEDHHSNLYEDGHMPFMQRITWTGIALHAGNLPGHPASHGCIRLPHTFAQHLFDLTNLGLRVLVVRDDIAPVEITHPALFKPNPTLSLPATLPADRPAGFGRIAARREVSPTSGYQRHLEHLKAIAAAKSAEAEAATRRAKQARLAATRKASEIGPVERQLRAAETNQARAEKALKDAERALEAAASPEATQKAEAAKSKAAAKLAEAQAQVEKLRSQLQAKKEAAARADEEAKALEAARDAAVEEAKAANRRTAPVSVFVSRKMQRIYVRQANEPIFEGPITIRDPDKPIGTFVFTALNYQNEGDVRWSVVSMYQNPLDPDMRSASEARSGAQRRRGETRHSEPPATDAAAAKAALDRLTIPQEALEHITDVLPGSSLIVSDEAASIETGKDTDFIVLMSGEPQGALKNRRREPIAQFGYDGPFRRSPWGGWPFWN
jgi:hypothetical protein